ncbi:MAG: ABC transporter substrate-binding protein [Chloroflexi bacterium]|nr:ABC transporter substrate-binding protein [Chloroflexota bacterium]
MIYIGLDDTDNSTSRGTGRLARAIAGQLARRFTVLGVTRHQFLVDPRIPMTAHNSSATIHLEAEEDGELAPLADQVQAIMQADFQPGSDPGLCLARTVSAEMIEFGRRAKVDLVTQAQARAIAERCGCILRGLGGTQDGVIGALAGVGLAASGEDGRFVSLGTLRDLTGVQPVESILASGVHEVRTLDGFVLAQGQVDTQGKLRPAVRGHYAVLFVKPQEDSPSIWLAVKID